METEVRINGVLMGWWVEREEEWGTSHTVGGESIRYKICDYSRIFVPNDWENKQ